MARFAGLGLGINNISDNFSDFNNSIRRGATEDALVARLIELVSNLTLLEA